MARKTDVDAWIQTCTGRRFRPLSNDPGEVLICDIAHALANLCRFTGHTIRFYSVAQHSVLVSRACPRPVALWGLLHDASEAYLNDLCTPIKHRLPEYQHAEKRLQRIIARTFALPWPQPAAVTTADRRLLLAERRDLMPGSWQWACDAWLIKPWPWKVRPWTPQRAKREFLLCFQELTE